MQTGPERLCGRRKRRNQPSDGPAPIRDGDFMPFPNFFDQSRQVLSRLTNSCFFHTNIVLHVACENKRQAVILPMDCQNYFGRGSTRAFSPHVRRQRAFVSADVPGFTLTSMS